MNENKKSTKAFQLTLIARLLILTNTLLLAAATTWFPEIITTVPGQTTNDPTILYQLIILVLIFDVLVLLGAVLLRIKPAHRKTWGSMIIVFSIPCVLTGGGFIIGFILGIIGGVYATLAGSGAGGSEVMFRIGDTIFTVTAKGVAVSGTLALLGLALAGLGFARRRRPH